MKNIFVEERRQELENIFLELKPNFPVTDLVHVSLEYDPGRSLGGSFNMIKHIGYDNITEAEDIVYIRRMGDCVVRPKIVADSLFFGEYDPKGKRAIIAHELGHMEYYLKDGYDLDRIVRIAEWSTRHNIYFTNLVCGADYDYEGWKDEPSIEDLVEWRTYLELFADDCSLRVGYGEDILAILEKDLIQLDIFNFSAAYPESKKRLKDRVSNIKSKLK